MRNRKTKKKALVLSMALVAGLLVPAEMSAQGLFGGPQPTSNDNQSMLNSGNRGGGMEWQGGGMTTQDPTQEAPLGSGLLVLVAAGAGYAALKRKEEQK